MRPYQEIAHMAVEHPVMGLPIPDQGGAFQLWGLAIIASWEGGWDHVSVSRRDRTPSWDEMETVKRLFFEENETAMQLHVPVAEHINNHPYCLHLWRPHGVSIPMPPQGMV